MATEFRSLKVKSTAQVRFGSMGGTPYIIVPCIMIKEGVIRAMQAPKPEYVPASTLSKAPSGWNGRPIVLDHPKEGTANLPDVLERLCFGYVFNTSYRDAALHSELWLDAAKAEKVGPEAVKIVNKAKNGEMFEVSVGGIIVLAMASGKFEEKEYEGVWADLTPDHLAALPEGIPGACSTEMGCGAPRAAAEGGSMCDTPKPRSLRERLFGLLRFRSAKSEEDMSDTEVRTALDKALRAAVPGFDGVHSVFPGDKEVVYATYLEGTVKFFRRAYTMGEDGVALADGTEQVEPITRFEVVVTASSGEPATPQNDRSDDMDKAARIAALIASTENDFTETDRPMLEAASDTRLEQLSAPRTAAAPAVVQTPAPAPTPVPAVAAPVVAAPAAPRTAAEYVKEAPAEIREVLEEGLRSASQRKDNLVRTLTGAKKKCPYTEQELRAMSSVELEKLIQLAGLDQPAEDYSLRSAGGARDDKDSEAIPPPPDIYKTIREAASPTRA